jgi:cobalt-zinc-cadmium efflux system membrane fusion protein
VDLSVYQKDLPYIRKGQEAVISAGRGIPDARGRIAYIGPLVGEETRTALARVVLLNPQGYWRPGLFVNASVAVEEAEVPLLVRKSAVQDIDKQTCLFVRTVEGFEVQLIEVGREDETHVEIISGLEVGQIYVAEGAFTLKAQLARGSFGHGHVH